MKPKALDLFCGAGGATRGLQQAGFHVTGVDIRPQPRYVGDVFHQADAMTFPLDGYDFVWASPPCQAYSWAAKRWSRARADLVAVTRTRLRETGLPYVIENVPGAPLESYFRLCGVMFGLNVIRHRHFEPAPGMMFYVPDHQPHDAPVEIRGKVRSAYACVAGHGGEGYTYKISDWKDAMGIGWMNRDELVEAIPPAYSEFIGRQAMQFLEATCAITTTAT